MKGRIAILVDDGIATGLTIKAAVESLKQAEPKKIVVAVPVAPHETVEELRKQADEVIALQDDPYYLGTVGAYYDDFPQVTDQEVVEILHDQI